MHILSVFGLCVLVHTLGADDDSTNKSCGGVECHAQYGECHETEGGVRVCECVQGWEGDGLQCDNEDECQYGMHNCGESDAQCLDTPGSFICYCPTGFNFGSSSPDSSKCTDVDECLRQKEAQSVDPCAKVKCSSSSAVQDVSWSKAKCVNVPGSFFCVCPSAASNGSTSESPPVDNLKNATATKEHTVDGKEVIHVLLATAGFVLVTLALYYAVTRAMTFVRHHNCIQELRNSRNYNTYTRWASGSSAEADDDVRYIPRGARPAMTSGGDVTLQKETTFQEE